jgi:hypothetical protein
MGSEWGGWLGGCGLDSTSSGQGPVESCCECGDEPSGSCATELVIILLPKDRHLCLNSARQIHPYIIFLNDPI